MPKGKRTIKIENTEPVSKEEKKYVVDSGLSLNMSWINNYHGKLGKKYMKKCTIV